MPPPAPFTVNVMDTVPAGAVADTYPVHVWVPLQLAATGVVAGGAAAAGVTAGPTRPTALTTLSMDTARRPAMASEATWKRREYRLPSGDVDMDGIPPLERPPGPAGADVDRTVVARVVERERH
jgi:hypothetical protein